jgi:hypothetical protein
MFIAIPYSKQFYIRVIFAFSGLYLAISSELTSERWIFEIWRISRAQYQALKTFNLSDTKTKKDRQIKSN